MKHPYRMLETLFRRKDAADPDSAGTVKLPELARESEARLDTLHNRQWNVQLKMIDLTEEDLRLIERIRPIILERIDEVVDHFYQSVIEIAELRSIIERHSTVERLRETLRRHLAEMLSGKLDDEFVRKRLRIAEVHQRIGLEPKWYIGAFQNLQSAFLTAVQPHVHDSAESLQISKAITKLLSFEQQLVLEAYEHNMNEDREKQYERVKRELKQAISDISQELAAITQQTSASSQELIAASHQVSESVSVSAGMAVQSKQFADAGSDRVNGLRERISAIADSTQQVQQAIAHLKDSSRQIGGIVTIVRDISEQTKLLSLNASIEAARAGQHGAGFSVVAMEVKKLSDETKEAVAQISELVTRSDRFTQQLVESVDDVRRHVEAGELESGHTGEAFTQIVKALDTGLEEIAKAELEMRSFLEAIGQMGEANSRAAVSAERLDETMREYG